MDQTEQLDQQMLFAIEYVKDFNGTRAAQRAGFQGNDDSLAVTASRLLRYAKVQNKIRDLLAANAMAAEEALWRLAQMARLDISQFIKAKNGSFEINWSSVNKYGFLIKSITQTRYGPKLELHDSQKALELIGKHYGLFTDKIEHTWKAQLPEGYEPTAVQRQFAQLIAQAALKAKDEPTDN